MANGCSTPVISTSATLTVCTPPAITGNPTNQSAVATFSATFTASANGTPTPSYQWQNSTDGGTNWNDVGGATSASYTFTTAQSQNGYQYRCVASNGCGSGVTTTAATLTVCTQPSITGNPSNQTVPNNNSATFTASATGTPAPSYQWQVSTDGGTSWADVPGETNASYTFTSAQSQNGYQYRCVASNGCGVNATTTAATLTVCTPPTITANPSNQSVTEGTPVSFTASASGVPAPSYQWQYSTDNGANWNNVGGATSAAYGLTPTASQNGWQYRCVASNGCGSNAVSIAATLTVCSQAAITAPPTNQTVTANQNVTFTVGASGTPTLYYQWQYSLDNGANWNNIAGQTAASYSHNALTTENGWQYRCGAYTGCLAVAYSGAATLTVCTPPSITQQPSSQTSKQVGDVVTFTVTVAAEVTSPSYQWERTDDNGAHWANVTAGSGSTTAAYTFTVAPGDGSARFRCNITNSCGQLYSSEVTVGVCTAAAFSSQPSNQNVVSGNSATFSATASGTPVPTYQWQNSVDGGANWNNVTAATGSTYTFTTASNQNGWQYRCVASNGCGSPAYSTAAILSVCTPPVVNTNPANQNATAGQSATFTVTASGVPAPSYQWQNSTDGGTTFSDVPGATAATYTFTTASNQNGWYYRCVASNGCASPAVSSSALLSVCTPAAITANPSNQNVTAGQSASFTASATGDGVLYLWQYSSDGGGNWNDIATANAATYSFTTASNQNGWQYRCRATAVCGGPAYSAAAILSVCTPAAITANPSSQSVTEGQSATFTASASGTPSPAYQWQNSTDGGTIWNDVAGATAATYSFTAAAGQNGWQFRCRASNGCGSPVTTGAALTVCSQAAITASPASQTITAGLPVTFTAAASGTPTISYQWQNSTDGGATWNSIPGATTASYAHTALTAENGWRFRCGAYTGCLSWAYSSAAPLTVCTPPNITLQPVSQPGKQVGDVVTFTVTVAPEVTSPSYQWQRTDDAGAHWGNVSAGSGANTASYTFTVASGDGSAQFRCNVTNSCGQLYSDAVSIGVCTAVSLTQNPLDLSVVANQTATFTVAASGVPVPSYQWQYSVDGGANWNNVTGVNAATYAFTAASSQNGWKYRCVASNGCGSPATSTAATLGVCTPPVVNTNPANQNVTSGQAATFTASATGVPAPTYQWQDSATGATTWNNITGATAATYSFTTASSQNGWKFRCVASNGCASPAVSSSATLAVCAPAAITASPANQGVNAGQSATFSASASGDGAISYQWQNSTDAGTTWNDVPGAASATYTFTAASNQNGWQYRCSATGICGGTAYSAAATLSVCTPPSITANPSNQSVNAGQSATFTASASGAPAPSYQWQSSADAGANWNDVAGATAATYTFAATAGQHGWQYRCRATGCGVSSVSSAATLIVCSQAAITTPPANQSDTAGHSATFSVSASGTPALSYQWQDSTIGGAGWADVAGATGRTYTFTTATAQNGWKFRCVASTGCFSPAVSAAAVLTVCTPPAIVSQPSSQPGRQVGDAVTFTVAAAAEVTSPSYQWQRTDDNGLHWTNVTAGTGTTTASYTFTVASGDANAQFRCSVTNPCGQLYSVAVSIGVCTAVSITANPANQSVTATQTATFTVSASGTPAPSYQWQDSVTGTAGWKDITGANASTYSFTAATNQDGWKYHCVASNGCGASAVSAVALLGVCTPPHVVGQPQDQDKNIGETAVFAVNATGSLLAYQWQQSADGIAWINATLGTGATTPELRVVSSIANSSMKFRCMVQNGCGRDSTTAATLRVCSPPVVTTQPKDTMTVVIGGSVSLPITCTGTAPLLFQWQRSVDKQVWMPVLAETLSVSTFVPAQTDTVVYYKCWIRNKCGEAYSSVITLRVCTPIAISAQSVDNKSVLVGDTVTFSVTARGTNAAFAWQKKKAGDTAFAAIASATQASYSFAAQAGDSGTQFRCAVSGACGTPLVSQTALVLAYAPLRAAFSISDTMGPAPLTVNFYDSSKGSFTKRVWDFGDGTALDSTSKDTSHTYATSGVYTVRLTVSGPAPRGTVFTEKKLTIWDRRGNPILISGTYLTPQTVAITFKNFNAIVPPAPLARVDSVGLWYSVGGLPQSADASTGLKNYTLETLKSRGIEFTDTLTVPQLTGGESVYGFMNAIKWSIGDRTPFGAANGTLVLMKDTVPIDNVLLISGAYVPDTTARILLDNVKLLDTSKVDSVGIWYSLTSSTPDFTDKNFTKWIPATAVFGAGDKYSYYINNPLFNSAEDTMYAAVILRAKNGRTSAATTTFFVVGKKRPPNPLFLHAKAISPTTVRLTWNNISSLSMERMIIWYRTGQPVPHVADLTSLNLDSLVPPMNDTVIVSDKFSEKTRYFFGAQVYKDRLWSFVTDSSSASDSTWEALTKLDSNSLAFTRRPYFDSTVNQIKVWWSVDPAQSESLYVGILYSTDSMPTVSTGQQQVIRVTGARDSIYVNLKENLKFHTKYYISLWLRRAGGKWTDPTARCMDSVLTPWFTQEAVVYSRQLFDTVYAFNNTVRIVNQPTDVNTTHNAVLYFNPDTSTLKDLTPVSIGIRFRDKGLVPFYLGLKIDSVPAGYTYNDIRIYRLDSAGMWVLDDAPFITDSASGYGSVLTNRLTLPFVAMVDTRKPTARVVSDIRDSVVESKDIIDTFAVSDNIANVRWWFASAKGNEPYVPRDSGVLSDTSATLILTIPGALVSRDYGVRGLFTVSDGVHIVTANVSRRVIRDSLDFEPIEKMVWTPLSVSTALDSPQVKKVLTATWGGGREWTYDNTKLRMYRWSPNAGNAAELNKWVEYSDKTDSAFAFTRGNLVWAKAGDPTTIRYGRGVTPSLTDTVTIRLAPGQWTDFGLPFRFNVTAGDILAATRQAGGVTDSLELYKWTRGQNATGNFRCEALFIRTIVNLNNEASPLVYADVSGFAAFNAWKDTVVLSIPPIPQSMSKAGAAKNAAVEGWSVRVVSRLSDGSGLSPVYCGYTKGKIAATTLYPLGPSFVKTSVGVFDNRTKKVFGHSMAHAMADGGWAWLLAFSNTSALREAVSYHVENTTLLPQELLCRMYNASTGKFEDMSAGDAALSLAPDSRDYRWLLVGTGAYLAKASIIARPGVLAFAGTYPNPFARFVRIHYSLPYEGVSGIRFSIYNMAGKTVWHREIATGIAYGASDLIWDGKTADGRSIAAGIYVIRMVAVNDKKKPMGVFDRKMTFMP
jgi:PKD repeat protein